MELSCSLLLLFTDVPLIAIMIQLQGGGVETLLWEGVVQYDSVMQLDGIFCGDVVFDSDWMAYRVGQQFFQKKKKITSFKSLIRRFKIFGVIELRKCLFQ